MDNPSASPSPKQLKIESVIEREGELEENLAIFEKDLGLGDDFVMLSMPLSTMWIASGPSDPQIATISRVLSDYTLSLRKKLTMLVTRDYVEQMALWL